MLGMKKVGLKGGGNVIAMPRKNMLGSRLTPKAFVPFCKQCSA
jgi:hypothetical protein